MRKFVPDLNPAARAEFLRHFPVSCETIHRLDRYAELLVEWNEKFNLIGEKTIPILWQRHFLDSAQLIKYIPASARILADLGSGAGFPGLVLSIMGVPDVHLIDSIGKKAGFLRMAVDELGLKAVVHQARIESLYKLRADVITARALKPLPQLLKLAKPLMKKETLCLFLKGQQVADELTESAKYWRFTCEKFPSLSDISGTVLKISELVQHGSGRKSKK